MRFNEFPEFKTSRLVLRRLTLDDTDILLNHYLDGNDSEYMLFGPFTNKESAVKLIQWSERLISDDQGVIWAVDVKDTGQLIGIVDYIHKNYDNGVPYRSEIGYDLSPSEWGKGFMVEAVHPTVEYAFQKLHISRIEASVDIHNFRSIRVLMKLGFQFEGILRKYGCMQGKLYDAAMFSLLRDHNC